MFGINEVKKEVLDLKHWIMVLKRGIDEMDKRIPISPCCGVITEENDEEEKVTLENLDCRLCQIMDSVEALEKLIPLIVDMHDVLCLKKNEKKEILDRFDSSLSKINEMLMEFKGCISMSRAALSDKKEYDKDREILQGMVENCKQFYKHQESVSGQHFKIDSIYNAICEDKTKKLRKTRKKVPAASS